MNSSTLARLVMLGTLLAPAAGKASGDAQRVVAALDTEYQAAVERNDWQTMDRILHPDFTLVLGNGKVITRADLIASARDKTTTYQKQVEMPDTQTVRLFGDDTATVTALLWLKGKRNGDGTEFEYRLWFTDTYVRTAAGWKYAFGQASLRLP
jgi:ketosteroid isomerase-like protein